MLGQYRQKIAGKGQVLADEHPVLCAAEIYAEHQFGANDLRVLDQNLLHIIREHHRQRSSMPWQDWTLLRYNTRKAAMQR